MAAAPAVKFSTFAPGTKAAGANAANTVQLKAGQTLHFQPGKGYYAGPAHAPAPTFDPTTPGGHPALPFVAPRQAPGRVPPPVVRPPVDPFAAQTAAQVDARASAIAGADVLPQQQELQRQQALADQQARNRDAEIQGFGLAAGGLLQGIEPQVQSAYSQAVTDQGQLGAGLATGVGTDLAAQQAQDQAFAASQGQQTHDTTSAPALHDSIQMLQGVIPGSQLAAQGAAAATAAAQAPQISLDATREQLDLAHANAVAANDGFAQKLIALAATEPGLKAQALTQLNQYELDKANYRQTVANSRADNARQDRALRDNETAAGIGALTKADAAAAALDKTNREFKFKYAQLAFKSKEDAAKAKLLGKQWDVQASRAVGHVVYKDGSENSAIKVAQSVAANPAQKAKVASFKAQSAARVKAFNYATTIHGKPAPNPKYGKGILAGKGRYIADPSQKYGVPGGVFPPAFKGGQATTNDPKRAARTGAGASSYAEAQQKVLAEIGAEGLQQIYGLSDAKIMTIVNQALARAGWRK